jgi:tetratricopeptide (TPR) repeat protein
MKILFFILIVLLPNKLFATDLVTSHVTAFHLDKLWQNRETTTGEQSIQTFLNSLNTLPDNFEIDWKISRLSYFLGNFFEKDSLNKLNVERIFQIGTHAGKRAKELENKRVEGYYWYAVNLGKYSLLQGKMDALEKAPEMRDALLQAAKIDPSYHWGGPYRILGCLYDQLPPFISFGDKEEARKYFKEAINMGPNFKMNLIYYADTLSDDKEKLALLNSAKTKADVDGQIEETRYKKELEIRFKNLKN